MPELVYVGELSVGALCPSVLGAFGPVIAGLQARLTGCLKLTAHLAATPPTITANLQLVTQLLATLTAAIAVGAPPVPDFGITAVATQIATIELSLQSLLALQALLGAEMFVFTYAGPTTELGAAAAASLAGGFPDGSGPGTQAFALLLATPSAAGWAAMSAFFAGAG